MSKPLDVKFSSDFYFAIFLFPHYLRVLEFANEYSCSLLKLIVPLFSKNFEFVSNS